MFAIRRIHDDLRSIDASVLDQVDAILAAQFPDVARKVSAALRERLRDPLSARLRTLVYVAEGERRKLLGFAIVIHEPVLRFAYLDFLAADLGLTGRGIGGALYQRLREDAQAAGAQGLFFECLPDAPAEYPDEPATVRENRARLRFYQRFGALPIVGTAYEMPIKPGDRAMPHLVYDALGHGPLRRAYARRSVKALLERKYKDLCPPAYVRAVVASFRDDPVKLRVPVVVPPAAPRPTAGAGHPPMPIVVSERHEIHHVRERGYVEAPARIDLIAAALRQSANVRFAPPRSYGIAPITAVHDRAFVAYLRQACAAAPAEMSIYPYVFPIRNAARPPRSLALRAGYYCIDTFTPIHRNAFAAARGAVNAALTAADEVLRGARFAYALVRPPGHHAEARAFGGFCYFNNAAVAAQRLSGHGRVAVLDIDYHHGNGTQQIFAAREDVLTVSIHGHPRDAYPYFAGFEDECGEGAGRGYNLNIPLREGIEGPRYLRALGRALKRIAQYSPDFLVVSLGFDTARGDPTGSWLLDARDLAEVGRRIGGSGYPTLVVQEGGYRTRTLGRNAAAFFRGLLARARGPGG